MLTVRQVLSLTGLGLAFWVAATLAIRWSGQAIVDPVRGGLMFVTALPFGWLSVLLTKRAACLAREQLAAGVALAGAAAMLADGAALRWAPWVYGADDVVVRLGAAWLLWGYGVSFALALLMGGGVLRTRNSAGSAP